MAEKSLSETLAEILLKALIDIANPTMGISGSDYAPFADLMPIVSFCLVFLDQVRVRVRVRRISDHLLLID